MTECLIVLKIVITHSAVNKIAYFTVLIYLVEIETSVYYYVYLLLFTCSIIVLLLWLLLLVSN